MTALASAAAARSAAAALLAVAGLASMGPARAHDFWIEPSTFHPAAGTTVTIGLRAGQNFVGDPVPRFERGIERFVVRQDGSEQPIVGIENVDPAGFLQARGGSTAVIAYASTGAPIELPAAQFEDYLRQVGLEPIIELRARRGEQAKPGRERFYRYAKALLAGERTSAAVTRPVGLAYEIVPDTDPTDPAAPQNILRGRVLYANKPLAGALVEAYLYSDPSVHFATRSDAGGAFAFTLPRAGVWLIKSVHMARASIFSSADWESFWASLTFELPAARPPPGAQDPR